MYTELIEASRHFSVKQSMHDRDNGSQRIDLIQCMNDASLLLVDKNIDMTRCESYRNAALKELDVHLTICDVLTNVKSARRKLGSDHIIRLYGYYLLGPRLHLVQEYCALGDILTILQHSPTSFTCEYQIREIFLQICEGVRFLHQSCDVAHLDLSLENILLTKSGCVRICDFEHAVWLRKGQDKTRVNSVGKRLYAAPEVHTAEFMDAMKADVWSLGIILYILVAKVPFIQVASVEDLVFCYILRHGTRAAINKLGGISSASSNLVDLIARLLTVDAASRCSVDEAIHHSWMRNLRTERLGESSKRRTLGRERLSSTSSVNAMRCNRIPESTKARKFRSYSESDDCIALTWREASPTASAASTAAVTC